MTRATSSPTACADALDRAPGDLFARQPQRVPGHFEGRARRVGVSVCVVVRRDDAQRVRGARVGQRDASPVVQSDDEVVGGVGTRGATVSAVASTKSPGNKSTRTAARRCGHCAARRRTRAPDGSAASTRRRHRGLARRGRGSRWRGWRSARRTAPVARGGSVRRWSTCHRPRR